MVPHEHRLLLNLPDRVRMADPLLCRASPELHIRRKFVGRLRRTFKHRERKTVQCRNLLILVEIETRTLF